MRKILLSMIMLLLSVIITQAQTGPSAWNFVGDNNWDSEHVVYVGLVDADGNAVSFGDNDQVWLGAFFGDVCRGQVLATKQHDIWYFPMRVKGSTEDDNTEISFRLFKNNAEYVLSGEKLTYSNNATTGTLSNLYKLKFVEPQTYTFPNQLTVDVNGTLDLLPLFEWVPENANIPTNISWDFLNNQDYIKVQDNVLSGIAPNKNVYLGLSVGDLKDSDGNNSIDVFVRKRITGLTLNEGYDDRQCYVGETGELTEIMKTCYTVTPEDANEDLVWSWTPENSFTESVANEQKQWTPNVAGHHKLILTGGDHSITLPLYVMNHITSMEPNIREIHMFVGDELGALLPYAYTFTPSEYINNSVHAMIDRDEDGILSQDEYGKITAVKASDKTATISVFAVDSKDAYATHIVHVYPNVTGVNVKNETLNVEYTDEEVYISNEFADNYTFTPDETYKAVAGEVESSNPEVCSATYTDLYGWTVIAKKVGVANFTITHTNKRTTVQNGAIVTSDVAAVGKFAVNVTQGLTGFTLEDVVMGIDEVGKLTLTPVPANVTVDPKKVSVEISLNNNSTPWQLGRAAISSETYALDWLIYPEAVGQGKIFVNYDGAFFGEANITICQSFEQKGGWAWVTPFGGNVTSIENLYGEALQEMRSQSELMYNDPTYGYFGDLTMMERTKGYKVNIKEDQYVREYNTTMTYSPFREEATFTIGPKWNWFGSPYQFDQSVENVLKGADFANGDRIISKENGFAEYDGTKWAGTLTHLTAGEGYLIYNTQNIENGLTFTPEAELGKPTQSTNIIKHNSHRNIWHYDASKFADNMTIIADLGDDYASDRYSVGAYINDECRGEGAYVDGNWFITVHGDAASNGCNVSFRLYDTMSDETIEIESTQPYGTMAGSLRAPVRLKVLGSFSGVESVSIDAIDANVKYYTIDGLEVQNPTSGLYIVVEGKEVRKVYIK